MIAFLFTTSPLLGCMLCGAAVSVGKAQVSVLMFVDEQFSYCNYLLVCDISKYDILTVNTLICTLLDHIQKEEERGERRR